MAVGQLSWALSPLRRWVGGAEGGCLWGHLSCRTLRACCHVCGLEADAGGFTPVGFNIDATDTIVDVITAYQPLLEPYGIYYIRKGGSGVDINPLKEFGVPLSGFRTDSQRYMDLHHSAYDTFDKVHIRELQLGSGCMAALIYLVDAYGF